MLGSLHGILKVVGNYGPPAMACGELMGRHCNGGIMLWRVHRFNVLGYRSQGQNLRQVLARPHLRERLREIVALCAATAHSSH
jgi:hypothetical protein